MGQTVVFERFNIHLRLQHMGMFISFIVLSITGLPIKFEQSPISQWFVSLFGGFDTMLTVHLGAGVIMLLAFIYHLIYLVVYPVVLKKVSWAIVPGIKDFADFFQDVQYFIGLRKDPPRFGRYSYKEKFDYWAVFWGMAIMGGSGLMMWFPQIVAQYMPRWVIDSARYAHSDEAILAISAIFIWHFFNVHLHPKVFPMNPVWYKGVLTREEMEEEHPLELEKLEAESRTTVEKKNK